MNEDRSLIRYKYYLSLWGGAIVFLMSVILGVLVANSVSIIAGVIVVISSPFVIYLYLRYVMIDPFETIIFDSYGVSRKSGKNNCSLSWEEIKTLDVKYDWKNRWRNNDFVFTLIISNSTGKEINIGFNTTVSKDMKAKFIKHCKVQDLILRIEEILDKNYVKAIYKNRKGGST
jgi:hypothetical protein